MSKSTRQGLNATGAESMILVDGSAQTPIRPTDRGLAYGDGVFRTLLVRRGVAVQWLRHYAKLAADCAALGIRCPSQSVLSDELRDACERVDVSCAEHVAKIIVTRGNGARGYAYTNDLEPTRVVIATPRVPYPAAYAASGVRVRKCAVTLAHQPALAGVKHLNRLENVLARAEWSDSDIAEGLLCDAAGHAIGGTMTNVFIARGGTLVTPALDRCGVAGVTRQRVIDAARTHGVACAIRDVPWTELLAADEVILTNSLAGAWPVHEIDGAGRTPGPIVSAVQSWLSADDS